jgi:hypothetical protein
VEVTVADRLEIEITIAPDGDVRLETHGLKGEACLEETKALEGRLGRVKSRTRTGEYYQRAGATTAVKRR